MKIEYTVVRSPPQKRLSLIASLIAAMQRSKSPLSIDSKETSMAKKKVGGTGGREE